jgi:hypothetical protein
MENINSLKFKVFEITRFNLSGFYLILLNISPIAELGSPLQGILLALLEIDQ